MCLWRLQGLKLWNTIFARQWNARCRYCCESGGIPEIVIQNETGLFFEPDDHKMLAEQIKQIAGGRD